MKKNQLYRKFFKLRKHAEKGQYILKFSWENTCIYCVIDHISDYIKVDVAVLLQ